jgi:hypothetical protein
MWTRSSPLRSTPWLGPLAIITLAIIVLAIMVSIAGPAGADVGSWRWESARTA